MAPKKSQENLENRMLAIIAFFVALLGVPAFHSFIQEPTDLQSSSEVVNRLPASVKNEIQKAKEGKKVNSVKASCQTLPGPQKTNLAKIRIQFSDCLTGDLKIQNKTNQYTATIFPMQEQNYTTDFIDLIEGDNEIAISIKNSQNEWEEKSLRVFRISEIEK